MDEGEVSYYFRMSALSPATHRELSLIGTVVIQLDQMAPDERRRVVGYLADKYQNGE